MKIYFDTHIKSRGLSRVITALDMYLPANIEKVDSPELADLIVLHVIGRNEHITKQAMEIKEQGKQYAVIQYALQSTRNPNPQDWYQLWYSAKVVWSYYDLSTCIDNFYHAPLAADAGIFYPREAEKKYLVCTTGNCYQAECIGEVQLATWKLNQRALHIGDNFNSSPIVDYVSNVSDNEIAELYCSCKWIASLRRKDGFELPAVEALLCGVRPIMFDTPNYRQWFDGLVEFIPEGSVAGTTEYLRRLMADEPKPVTKEEIEETKNRFSWEQSIGGFWERCR